LPAPVAAPAGYLWWDSWAHLTTAFHALLADTVLAALPELGS
jgi:phospholipase/lecithinase/hemolysin